MNYRYIPGIKKKQMFGFNYFSLWSTSSQVDIFANTHDSQILLYFLPKVVTLITLDFSLKLLTNVTASPLTILLSLRSGSKAFPYPKI
jgi:hypothetical protein